MRSKIKVSTPNRKLGCNIAGALDSTHIDNAHIKSNIKLNSAHAYTMYIGDSQGKELSNNSRTLTKRNSSVHKSSTEMVEVSVRDDSNEAVRLMNWNKHLLSVLGLWPQTRNDLRYFLIISYYATVIILEYADLFKNMDDLEYAIWSLQESICLSEILIKLGTLRYYNREFGELLSTAIIDYNGLNYIFPEERKKFMMYINISRYFIRALMLSVILVAPTYYLKPLVIRLQIAENVNASTTYQLPYFVYSIYNIQSMQSYIIAYIIELPIAIISAFSNTATEVLMFTLVFYICGQLSVLAIRLRNLDKSKGHINIKTLVKRHIQLLRMGTSIKEAFNLVLLVHFVGVGIIIGLLNYLYLIFLLVKSVQDIATNQTTDLAFLIVYQFLILFGLFSHCMIGQCLYLESIDIYEAFYNCKWYDMSREDKMIITFCVARSQQPLCLTAGQFGIFSLELMTNVLKTSMAYLSLLRNVM